MLLREFRCWREMTGAELSRRSGVPQTSVSNHELGKSEPGVKAVVAYARALRVSTDQLLGLVPPPEGFDAALALAAAENFSDGEQTPQESSAPPQTPSHPVGAGGDAMAQQLQALDVPTSVAAWLRLANETLLLLQSREETERHRISEIEQTRRMAIEKVDAVEARARADIAQAARDAIEQARAVFGPRVSAGYAPGGERRGSTAGGDSWLPADTTGGDSAAAG